MSNFDGFYRAFEDRERGSGELILGRLDIYRPLLEDLVARYPQARALDVGCGRGEWLQLLQTLGIQAHGVDLDAGMLAACLAAGLSVEQGDALEWLVAQPDNSLALISAFHVVEHISFEQVQQLVAEAHRVLLPGGLLIMETPNPENLSVGAHTFYMDPSHERPLPPRLLQFVPEFVGFEHCWLWRLQESEHLRAGAEPALANVLLAVSPDYAVIACKGGVDIPGLEQLMAAPRGRGLELACAEYDAQHSAVLGQLSLQLAEAQARAGALEQQLAAQQQQLARMTSSFMWLLALPLRWASIQWRLLREQGLRQRSAALLGRLCRKPDNSQ